MNNKGVTLIELLIVIVVIGIISAFAVPAVSNYLEGAERQAVYQQAVAIRNAADTYCSYEASCSNGETIQWNQISDTVNGIDEATFGLDVDDTIVVATLSNGSWQVSLEAVTESGGSPAGDWEWVTATDPVDADSSETYVTVDDN